MTTRRLIAWVVPNVEHYELVPAASTPRDPWPRFGGYDLKEYGFKNYGCREGFWRTIRVLDDVRVDVTVSLCSSVPELFPEIGDAIASRSWEIMAHGVYNTAYWYGLDIDQQTAVLARIQQSFECTIGYRALGLLSPGVSGDGHTPVAAERAGIRYLADQWALDRPRLASGTDRVYEMPYSIDVNDAPLLHVTGHGRHPRELVHLLRTKIMTLRREPDPRPAVFGVAFHPYILGQPYFVRHLWDALQLLLEEGVEIRKASAILDELQPA